MGRESVAPCANGESGESSMTVIWYFISAFLLLRNFVLHIAKQRRFVLRVVNPLAHP